MTNGDPIVAMDRDGLVVLFSSGDADELYAVARALVDCGLSTFEVTLRAHGSLEALKKLLTRARSEDLPLAIGAGTVLERSQGRAAIEAGARFLFSPVLSEELVQLADESGVPYIPGCATPSEAHRALDLGCDTVKLFPADTIGGPRFVRSLLSVLPQLRCIPSGGIGPDVGALEEWFRSGAKAVAMGSSLFPGGDLSGLAQRLDDAVTAVATGRDRATA